MHDVVKADGVEDVLALKPFRKELEQPERKNAHCHRVQDVPKGRSLPQPSRLNHPWIYLYLHLSILPARDRRLARRHSPQASPQEFAAG